MNEQQKFNLYEKASLENVIKAYKENLEISHFNLILANSITIEEIIGNPPDKIEVIDIELPEMNKYNHIVLLNNYVVDLNKRLEDFQNDTKESKNQKIKTLTTLISECAQMEIQYYPYHRTLSFFNIDWRYNNLSIADSKISYNTTFIENVRYEMALRYEYFQYIKMRLDLCKMKLEAENPISKFLKWNKTSRPELIVTEILLALEEKGYIEYTSEKSKTEFIEEIRRIFSLKDFKFSEIISDINKRQRFRYKNLKALAKEIE
jgi:hypothetical protein